MAKRAIIKSFAKINLYLDVVCKRRDGYHNIETIFQTVSLGDTVEIEITSSPISIRCDNPLIPTDENNLVFKALLGFKKATGYRGGAAIGLRKRIPPAAGLGGGSSNAAAVIVGLNYLLRKRLSEDRMRAMASDIGADVPFFISGGLAAAWRIGDKLEHLSPIPRSYVVVAIPRNVGVSTAAAYAVVAAPVCNKAAPRTFSQCSDRLKAYAKALSSGRSLSANSAVVSMLHNSLERPVFSLHPEIESLKDSLLKSGAKGALMSGSGSAIFAPADSMNHAREIKKAIEKLRECVCFVTRTVDRGSVVTERL